MSKLLSWNKQNNNNNNTNTASNATINNGPSNDSKDDKRNWLHAPGALVSGHVVYLVKFFGSLPVDQPKGIEVVKDTIRKLQFAQQMKKAETGNQEKIKKVEITISVDGVAVQEPRTQKILRQFPLHNISYCADEKGVKKFFSFIAKTSKPFNDNDLNDCSNVVNSAVSCSDESHECFVFISNKLASDITLTIGQAFDLAYRKYINNTEKSDLVKAQEQILYLENIVAIYKNRLNELSQKLVKSDLEEFLAKMGIKDVIDVCIDSNSSTLVNNQEKSQDHLLVDTVHKSHCLSSKSMYLTSPLLPAVPPRNSIPCQTLYKPNNQKMEELLLNSDSDSDFDPRANETIDNCNSNKNNISGDLFGFEPAKTYGQQLFYNKNGNNNLISELNMKPLLAPPPKVAIPRRGTLVTNSNDVTSINTNTDLFGSDPFDLNEPTVQINKPNSVYMDNFSLESLDPLKK